VRRATENNRCVLNLATEIRVCAKLKYCKLQFGSEIMVFCVN